MTTNITAKQDIVQKREQIDNHLTTLVPECDGHKKDLIDAVRYALLAPGKRLRPIITLLITEALGGDVNAALSPACALEMIHASSLIHDDLPCMDDDDLRRGRPTLHKVFPESYAVLAGDYLLVYAFEVVLKENRLSAEQKNQLLLTLSKYTGVQGIIGGQIIDLASEGKTIDLPTLQIMHKEKTSALFSAALEFGGIVANTSPKNIELLTDLGYNLGMAFQIIDDILDITETSETLGKPANSDLNNAKATYPSITNLDTAKQHAKAYHDKALEIIEKIPGDHDAITYIADHIIARHC